MIKMMLQVYSLDDFFPVNQKVCRVKSCLKDVQVSFLLFFFYFHTSTLADGASLCVNDSKSSIKHFP